MTDFYFLGDPSLKVLSSNSTGTWAMAHKIRNAWSFFFFFFFYSLIYFTVCCSVIMVAFDMNMLFDRFWNRKKELK